MLNRILIHTATSQTAITAAFALLIFTAALLLFLQSPAEAQAQLENPQQPGRLKPQPGRAGYHLGRSQRRPRRLPPHVEEVRRQVAVLQKREHGRRRQRLPHRHVPHGVRPRSGNRIQRASTGPLPQQQRQRRTERPLVRPARGADDSGSAGQAHGTIDQPQPRQRTAVLDRPQRQFGITGYQILRGPDAANLSGAHRDTGATEHQLHRRQRYGRDGATPTPSGRGTPTASARSPMEYPR